MRKIFSALFVALTLFVILPNFRAFAAAGPIGWWKFDDGSGSTALDSSGNGDNGTLSGSVLPTWTTGETNGALSFSNGHVDIGTPAVLEGLQVPLTITAEFKTTSTSGLQPIYAAYLNGTGGQLWSLLRIDSGALHYYTSASNGGYQAFGSFTPTLNVWHSVAVTVSGSLSSSIVTIYLDGVSQTGSFGNMDTMPDTNVDIQIGGDQYGGGEIFHGNIEDVRVYNYALDSDQAADLPGADTTPPTSSLTVPTSDATIGGSAVTLTATSSDDVAVAGVTFYYDSTNKIGSEITATTSLNTYSTTWDATGLSDGSHTLIAVARDTSNNYATSTPVTVTVDNTPPGISAIASSTSSNGASITWTTGEVASAKVVYSSDTSYSSSTAETDTGTHVTNHNMSITGLISCTLYTFKVVSADVAGNYATSTANMFTTTGCLGGGTPSSATSTSVTVASAATSTIIDGGNTLTVASPANFTATSSVVVIQIKGLSSSAVLGDISKPSSSLSSAAPIVFDVTALLNNGTVLDSFNAPVTVSYQYTDADVSGLDKNSLVMYHYHDGVWLPLNNCSVDTSTNTITCTTPSFSVFAIFGTPLGTQNSGTSLYSSSGGGSIQAQVAYLLAHGWVTQANALKAEWYWLFPQTASTATGTSTDASTLFARNLTIGMTGVDVKALQQFLNNNGFVLASSGLGSLGNETTHFGVLTRKALAQFQIVHTISPAVGYFGPITRVFIDGKEK